MGKVDKMIAIRIKATGHVMTMASSAAYQLIASGVAAEVYETAAAAGHEVR